MITHFYLKGSRSIEKVRGNCARITAGRLAFVE